MDDGSIAGGPVHGVRNRLRTGRTLRVPRERTLGQGKSFVTPEVLISKRPATIEDRAILGHWEGDLILGLATRPCALN